MPNFFYAHWEPVQRQKPTLPDYPEVSRIQTESPGLPCGSPLFEWNTFEPHVSDHLGNLKGGPIYLGGRLQE